MPKVKCKECKSCNPKTEYCNYWDGSVFGDSDACEQFKPIITKCPNCGVKL